MFESSRRITHILVKSRAKANSMRLKRIFAKIYSAILYLNLNKVNV